MIDIEIRNASFGSSGTFGSNFRSTCIDHNTYTGRSKNLHSKPTLIHGRVHKSGFNCLYTRIHFIFLPHSVSKRLINSLSQILALFILLFLTTTNSFIRLYLAYDLFPQGGTGVPCYSLFELLASSFAIAGRELILAGYLFKDPCSVFGRMIWDC